MLMVVLFWVMLVGVLVVDVVVWLECCCGVIVG